MDRYLDFLRYLGAAPGPPEFRIPETEANRTRAMALLLGVGIDPGRDRFIAVNPVALWETKLWDQEIRKWRNEWRQSDLSWY